MSPAEYLTKKGLQFKTRGDNLVFNCPFCDDRDEKAAMHRETGVFNCMHHNKCGEKGTFWYFQHKMGDEPKMASYDDFVRRVAPAKKYVKPEVHPKALQDDHRKWLNDRGIDDDLIEEFSLRSEKGAIAFPYKKDGELVAVKYRTLDKKFWKTKDSEPVLFGRDGMEDNDTIIICEGEIDAISYRKYGYHAASVPSGVSDTTWIENEWDWLERFSVIYVSMDMDDAGRHAVEVLAERLGLWRCRDVRLPYKDINECLTNGVLAGEIDAAIQSAKEFRMSGIATPYDYKDEVVKILTDPSFGWGETTGIEELDALLKGWRWGELTVWSGRNGSGKTTFLNQLMLKTMAMNHSKVFIASLEMKPSRLVAQIMRQNDIPFREDVIGEALEKLAYDMFLFNRQGQVDLTFLLDVFEFAAKKYGCKHFVLDSLMRLDFDRMHKYESQEDALNRLVSFAQKYDAHVHLVAHPRKSQTDDDRPGKVDIAGAGDITNLAHNVLILWRPSDDMLSEMRAKGKMYDAVLYLKKNREFGKEGKIPLSFDYEHRRFSVYKDNPKDYL